MFAANCWTLCYPDRTRFVAACEWRYSDYSTRDLANRRLWLDGRKLGRMKFLPKKAQFFNQKKKGIRKWELAGFLLGFWFSSNNSKHELTTSCPGFRQSNAAVLFSRALFSKAKIESKWNRSSCLQMVEHLTYSIIVRRNAFQIIVKFVDPLFGRFEF